MLSPANTTYETATGGEHLAFLRRAAHDSDFRAALEADPRAALAGYGLSVNAEQLPSRVTLPSGESVLDALIDVEEDPEDNSTHFMWAAFFGS